MIVRAASQGAGRLVRVSLRDVPLRVRKAAARALIDEAHRAGGWDGLADAARLTRAYLAPSENAYLLPEEAVVAALGAVPTGGRRYVRVEVAGVEMNVPDGRA